MNLSKYIEYKILDWNNRLGLKAVRRRDEWVMLCPFHKETHPSFNVNADTGKWYCFGCSKGSSSFHKLVKIMSNKYNFKDDFDLVFKDDSLYVNLSTNNWNKNKVLKLMYVDDYGRSYLYNRGFNKKQVISIISFFDVFQLIIDKQKFLRFNIYDFNKILVGWVRRCIDNNSKIYQFKSGFDSKRYFYGEWKLDNSCNHLILVEGIFDYFKVKFAGYNVLAILSFSGASLKLARLSKVFKGKIYFMFDSDVSFLDKKVSDWIYYAKTFGLDNSIIEIPKDKDDPGSMSIYEIKNLVDRYLGKNV